MPVVQHMNAGDALFVVGSTSRDYDTALTAVLC